MSNSKLYDEFVDFVDKLNNTWSSLQKKYNITDEFMIVKSLDNFIYETNYKLKRDILDGIKRLKRTENMFMANGGRVIIDKKTNKIEYRKGETVILFEKLMSAFIENHDNLDNLLKFCEISMTHEIGHSLVNNETYVGMTVDEFDDYTNKIERNKDEVYKKLDNKDLTKDEYYHIYYEEIPAEKMANDRVGLTVQDMLDKENLINQ